MKISALVAIGFLFLMSCEKPQVNPNSIVFRENKYQLFQYKDKSVCSVHLCNKFIPENSKDSINFGEGNVIIYDLNKDGTDDLLIYYKHTDFRDHFGYLDIYLNGSTSLEDTKATRAKYKEKHWTWINVDEFPGLSEKKFMKIITQLSRE